MVLTQNANVEDRGQNFEPTMAILKNIFVKKRASIDFQFYAKENGYVAIIFKFVDFFNYYIFEIGGGDDITKRYFQLRKKIDGSFSIIKRISSEEELPNVPFFGYEKNTWHHVRIILRNDLILVLASILDTSSLVKILEEKDGTIPSGRVGFATYKTQAAFSEIQIKPLPFTMRKILIYK